jgi:hypothetical protein
MENAEHYIDRWQRAGLLDEPTAASIRAFEASGTAPAGRQWQVLLAISVCGTFRSNCPIEPSFKYATGQTSLC